MHSHDSATELLGFSLLLWLPVSFSEFSCQPCRCLSGSTVVPTPVNEETRPEEVQVPTATEQKAEPAVRSIILRAKIDLCWDTRASPSPGHLTLARSLPRKATVLSDSTLGPQGPLQHSGCTQRMSGRQERLLMNHARTGDPGVHRGDCSARESKALSLFLLGMPKLPQRSLKLEGP